MGRNNKNKLLVIFFLLIFIITGAGFAVKTQGTLKKSIVKKTGFSMESMSIYNGVFGKDKNNNDVFYGTTIMGDNSTSFFVYDIGSSRVVKNINIQGVCGSNIMSFNDGSIYIGTYSKAALFKYDINSGQIRKLFEIPGEEESVCDFKIYNNKVYIGTYPNSVVYMYDLNTEKLTNLGSMFNLNYVNSIEYSDGKIYAGIGPKAHLVQFNLNTGKKSEIMLPYGAGRDTFVNTLKIIGDKLFIGMLPSNMVLSYDLKTHEFIKEIGRIGDNFNQNPDFSPDVRHFTGMSGNIFAYDMEKKELSCLEHNTGVKISDVIDNSYIACLSPEGVFTETDFRGVVTKTVDLTDAGFHGPKALPMFSYGNNGTLYFGGKRMAIYDTGKKAARYEIVPGEPKAIAAAGQDLYTANYTDAKIWKYDINSVNNGAVNLKDENNLMFKIQGQNRPLAMLSIPQNNEIVIASDPNYGDYGSAVTIYNTSTRNYNVITGITGQQSIKCMVADRNNPDYIYIGTTNRGTYGNKALNENAHVIKYDIAHRKKVYDIVPDNKNSIIRSMAAAGNKLFFVTENEYNLYSLNTSDFKTVKLQKKSHMKEILGASDGNLYGISEKAVWNISTDTLKASQIGPNLHYLSNIFEDAPADKVYFFDNDNLFVLQ